MVILIDPPAWPAHGTLWSHLISDSDYDELHEFAGRLRVPRRGFDLDHYDVPASKYELALTLGAQAVSAKEVVHRLRNAGLRVRQAERGIMQPVRRREYLADEWALLGRSLGLARVTQDEEAWRRLGESLLTRWNEPHRSYHNEQHLEDVLLALNHLGIRGERVSPTALLAAWFHDAVYTGSPEADEYASAQLASHALSTFDLEPALSAQVSDLIVATIPARELRAPDPVLAQLLDADLSIFASSPQRYSEYASAVRSEYAHVPAQEFAAGRARVLTSYLAQPTIYRTATGQELWEARARANVTGELTLLTAGGSAIPS